jgi:hypothetical protein
MVQVDAEIEQDLIAGRKIGAIKRYREATGASLFVAKQTVDERERLLRQSGRLPAKNPISIKGPVFIIVGVFVVAVLIAVMVTIFFAGKALG